MRRFLTTGVCLFSLAIALNACSIATTAQLPENIKAEVAHLNPPLQGYSLDVIAHTRGAIEISGYVSSEVDKQRVLAAAKSVVGVTTIQDNLSVKEGLATSAEVASKFQGPIFQKLEDELIGAQYLVSIVDRSGDVVVQGSVDSLLTKGRIIEVVKAVVGSNARVVDEVKLAAAPSDRWISDQVTSEIKKRFPSWSDKVSVRGVSKGIVTLAGALGDHWDVDSVLASVVMVPGVKDLRSEITINGEPYSSGGIRRSNK